MGPPMNHFLYAPLATCALASAAFGLAGAAAAVPADPSPGAASAAPANPSSVGTTISGLASRGYRVIVTRVGSAPSNRCTVGQVRPGGTYFRTEPGAGDDHTVTVVSRTVHLDVVC